MVGLGDFHITKSSLYTVGVVTGEGVPSISERAEVKEGVGALTERAAMAAWRAGLGRDRMGSGALS